ncbi:MAG: DUF1553 domain-containing protein [Planctomycetaceae bacterium]
MRLSVHYTVVSALTGRFAVWLLISLVSVSEASDAAIVRYRRDVRPILSDKCFQCHGPDAAKRQADLRLDDPKSAFDHRDGKPAIVAGDAARSRLYQRLVTNDPSERMPPADTGLTLSTEEIATLNRWINDGAEYEPHWAFIAPRKSPMSFPTDRGSYNLVDDYLRDRLVREELSSSPPADRTTVIRRATFDVTGLPPTLMEVDDFLAADAPDAYERLLDRLLASPRYGERMAMPWMQAARYADTNGYQTDGPRVMWRWRDWVIDAYNRNLPFDQFTIEQLAGDLLPQPNLDQLIATGFNRNHRGNAEGGIIPEEYLVEYVVDRVETTSTVWLGLTLGCCRCHDHKYDPVSQREFYGLFALFNQVPELGKTLRNENSPPLIKAPTRDQQHQLARLEDEVGRARAAWEAAQPMVTEAQRAWERRLPEDDRADGTVTRLLEFRQTFAEHAKFDGTRVVDLGNVGDVGETDRFVFSAWVEVDDPQPQTILARMEPELAYKGYELRTLDGKLQLILSGRILDDLIRVETRDAVLADGRHHVLVTYDASKLSTGIAMFIDGRPAAVRVLADLLSNPFKSKDGKFQIGGGGTSEKFRGVLDDIRVYRGQLTPDELLAVSVAKPIDELALIPVARRTTAELAKLQEYFLTQRAAEEFKSLRSAWLAALAARQQFLEAVPTTMIMRDQPGLRETHLLLRGEYNRPGDIVTPGTPACLPNDEGTNRLDLARWLVSPEHPLTARVTVNRLWAQYFGTGLVKTTEDFGAQGELPSHPELLDWLALEFVRLGWDVKQFQRKILASAAYQQSARVSPELLARDPDNRLLARGPRFRLTAEMLRDAALSVAGLLVEELGGPSVKPYQPPGLWEELSSDVTGSFSNYVPDQGAGLYRRGLYTFWKRTVSPPMMTLLDAPTRDMCRVNTLRTNTPLQALNLMNDVTYLEAARIFAEQMLREGGSQPASRIEWAFRTATARRPTGDELVVLTKGLDRRWRAYREQPALAAELLQQGAAPAGADLDPVELAAYTSVAAVLLNLDEFVTRE